MELTNIQKEFLAKKLQSLQTSKFRSSFHLTKKTKAYLAEKGYLTIEKHAIDFIHTRLAPSNILNDGKQTPMKNHPVFIAQHATATCCRSCLYKWHHIPKNRNLTPKEERFIVALIMEWLHQNDS